MAELNKKELRKDLQDVLNKHLSGVPAEAVAGFFISVVEAYNNRQAPSSVPVPEKVATTS